MMASILLVDDDKSVLDSLRMALEFSHYQVSTAMSCSEALKLIDEGGILPDLIITDYRLSDGQTGIQLIDSIQCALGQHMPALLLSGDIALAQSSDVKRIDCKVLLKPVSIKTLNKEISQLLSGKAH